MNNSNNNNNIKEITYKKSQAATYVIRMSGPNFSTVEIYRNKLAESGTAEILNRIRPGFSFCGVIIVDVIFILSYIICV